MKNIPFALLKSNYPSRQDVSTAALYESIGYPEFAANIYWRNTCALRVSLALIAAGVLVPGHMIIKAGRFKGRQFQPGQAKLSRFLAGPAVLGPPETYKSGTDALLAIRRRSGVVSFFQLGGESDTQGHIDIVAPDGYGDPTCGNTCYWSSVDIWFWPLK